MSLAEQLSGAKIIRRDDVRDLTLIWYGGHGLHAFDREGHEVAFWNIGDFAQGAASEAEVMADMDEKAATGEYPWTD